MFKFSFVVCGLSELNYCTGLHIMAVKNLKFRAGSDGNRRCCCGFAVLLLNEPPPLSCWLLLERDRFWDSACRRPLSAYCAGPLLGNRRGTLEGPHNHRFTENN